MILKILNKIFEILNRQKSSATLFLVVAAIFYLNIDRYEYNFFAHSSRLHMYEQTGAKITEFGPVNAEINGC